MTRFALDPSAHRRSNGSVLVAGSPLHLFRLGPAGVRAVDRIERGEAPADSAGPLLDALLDAGAVHPRPVGGTWTRADVTVVVPSLGRLPTWPVGCIEGVAGRVLVDDGSQPPLEPPPGWRVVRRPVNGGPAAARMTGLDEVGTPLVAFVDADATPAAGWLEPLLAHLDDPRVVLAAPRVTSFQGTGPENLRRIPGPTARKVVGGVRDRYEASRSPLDLGPTEGRVAAGTRISYVPAAALLARVDALRAAGGFDPALRTGEDVDLAWRLAATHRVRYEPASHVAHEPRSTWRGWLAQRAAYGESAAALDARHPGALPPAVCSRWSLGAWLLLAAGHPLAAAVMAIGTIAALARKLRPTTGPTTRPAAQPTAPPATTPAAPPAAPRASAVPTARTDALALAVLLAGRGTLTAGRQLAAAATRTWWPLTLAASATSRRARRLALAALVVPALLEWYERGPALDPATFVAVRALDDAAYGWGVWRGCLRLRRPGPLLPRVT